MNKENETPQTFCRYFNENICRSCSWLEVPYTEQVLKKEARLREALSFLPELNLLPTQASKETGFRNRVKVSVTGTVDHPVIGLLGEKDLDQGRSLLQCVVQHLKLNQVLSALPAWIKLANLIPYQIANRTGELKGVILFYAEASQEIYLRFVLRSQECVSRIRKLMPEIQKAFPEIVCISANLQSVPHAILEGPEEIPISERASIRYPLKHVELTLTPQAFVQTHSEMASTLYQTASEWIREMKPETFLELFCGQGAFSFFAAPFVKKSFGIEINSEAVNTANETAKRLKLGHLKFICADLTADFNSPQSIQALIKSIQPDCLLVNPPRRGIGDAGIKLILEEQPKHFIYSSCSVETLAQDLQNISHEYKIIRGQIFDMFPHTPHFEILTQFVRQ